jgi:hypothetical protein
VTRRCRRWSSRRQLLPIVVVAVIAPIAAVGWRAHAVAPEQRRTVALGTTSVHAVGGSVALVATVVNNDEVEHRVRAWFVLAPPGDGDAWRRAVARSSRQELVVGPERRVELRWDEPVTVAAGRYEVWAYVHRELAGDRWVHGDGTRVTGELTVAPEGTVLRRGAVPVGSAIVSDVVAWARTSGPFVRATVRGTVRLDTGVADPTRGIVAEVRAQRVGGTARSVDLGRVPVAGGPVRATFELDTDVPLPAGRYVLGVRLRDATGVVDDVAVDGPPLELPGDERIDRRGAPSGRLAIIDLDPPQLAADRSRVVAVVANTSARPVTGRAWFVVAPPGLDRPWEQASVLGVVRTVALAAGAAERVELAGDAVPAGATAEVSVWVWEDEPDRRQSDVLWWRAG